MMRTATNNVSTGQPIGYVMQGLEAHATAHGLEAHATAHGLEASATRGHAPPRLRTRIAAGVLGLCFVVLALPAQALEFRLTFPKDVRDTPFTGPVYLMFGRDEDGGRRREPRLGPNWFDPQPFFRIDAKDWKPGDALVFGPAVPGMRGTLGDLAAGPYRVQAVMRCNLDSPEVGAAPGDVYSEVSSVRLDPSAGEPIDLLLDRVVSARSFPEDDRVKYIELRSKLLSNFHGRDVLMRAAVVLPAGYAEQSDKRYPSLYVIPGFGGDHGMARMMLRMTPADSPVVKIVPDPSAFTGHHAFADSANNGPWGQALIEELIPHIETKFRIEPSARHRYVTGISSGGWSSLWLGVTYPESFAGVWAYSPDPVDFRDFQRIDIYAPDANMFRDEKGERRPLARRGDRVTLWYDDFAAMDEVIGQGGQLHSFEAVFSPKADDGRPCRLWDPKTGAIDPQTAKAWEKYDIRLVLERGGPELMRKLRGKLHIIAGDEDTFYLEGAVKRLAESLKDLGSDAQVEILPNTDHGGTFSRQRLSEIDRTISEQFSAAHTHD